MFRKLTVSRFLKSIFIFASLFGGVTSFVGVAVAIPMAKQTPGRESQAKAQDLSLILKLVDKNKFAEALRVLDLIERVQAKQAVAVHHPDKLTMIRARILFQMGKLNEAERAYLKIDKSSDYWFESAEERSQIYGRRGEYAKALELLQTVMAAPFENVIGPEPFFVASLTSLRICDYTSVFKANEAFKKRFVPRLERLKVFASADMQADPVVNELISKISLAKKLNFEVVGPLAKDLPRNTHRDLQLAKLAQQEQSTFRDRALVERLQNMARKEITEIEKLVSKLHLIEVESIERLYLAENSQDDRESQGQIEGEKYSLKFPKNDEVWLDELNHYSVQVEKCPAARPPSDKNLNKQVKL